MTHRGILVPFDLKEAITTTQAAKRAGRCERTIRAWCEFHGIGRRIAGGYYAVSKVALQMLLEGDDAALKLYRDGERGDARVARYFRELGPTAEDAHDASRGSSVRLSG